jgi:hypothetical protein
MLASLPIPGTTSTGTCFFFYNESDVLKKGLFIETPVSRGDDGITQFYGKFYCELHERRIEVKNFTDPVMLINHSSTYCLSVSLELFAGALHGPQHLHQIPFGLHLPILAQLPDLLLQFLHLHPQLPVPVLGSGWKNV